MRVKYRVLSVLLSLGLALLGLMLFLGLMDELSMVAQAQAQRLVAIHHFPGPCGPALQECIDSIDDGDTVIVDIPTKASGLFIDKPLTLDGKGYLEVLGTSPALTITADNVTISNTIFTGTLGSPVILIQSANTTTLQVITVTNGGTAGVLITGTASSGHLITGSLIYSNSGPGIHLAATTTLRLVNSDILSNTVIDGNGGGLCSNQPETHLRVEECLFKNNTAGGFGGGGLYIEGSMVLTGTHVVSNTAFYYGGGLFTWGNVILTDTQIIDNRAGLHGGGLASDGSVTLTETDVIRNVAGSSGGGLYAITAAMTGGFVRHNSAGINGGGLYVHALDIDRTSVTSNTASNFGGGLYAITATLTGGFVGHNSAETGGGGLRAYTLDMNRTSVISNAACGSGGGLYIGRVATISGTQVTSNTAGENGGGLYQRNASGQVDVTNSRFERNMAEQYSGGGLYVWAKLTLTKTQIVSNTAGGSGGGIHIYGSVFLTETQAVSNTAGLFGGGIYQRDNSEHVDIIGSHFERNIADYGGGLYVEGSTTLMEVQAINNTARQYGGGLNAITTTITSGLFERNVADYGGGLYVKGSATLINGRLERNAANNGGGLYVESNATLTGTQVISNLAEIQGGGLYQHSGDGKVQVTSGSFLGNIASQFGGGGLYIEGRAVLSGTSVISNTAESLGGGLYVIGDVSATLSLFERNMTMSSGGGLFAVGNTALTETQVINNVAMEEGGGLYSRGSAILVETQIVSNTAGEQGGGLYQWESSETVNVIGGCFERNVAQGSGGGLSAYGDVTLSATRVMSNSSGWSGGGLFGWGEVNVNQAQIVGNTGRVGGGLIVRDNAVLSATYVVSNTAGDAGGGLYQGIDLGWIHVINCRFERNRAIGQDGGGLFVWDAINLTRTQIVSNSAGGSGGGLYVWDSAALTETRVVNNVALWGGGLYQGEESGRVEVTGGRFERNVATLVNGGGLYVTGRTVLSGTQVISNSAEYHGGGLYQNSSTRQVDITVCRFEGNLAQRNGGGMSVAGNINLSGTNFINNITEWSGGGSFVEGDINVTGSCFEHNVAMQYDGGGLYVGGGMVSTRTKMISNTAGASGGGLYARGPVDAANDLFVANIAHVGAGIHLVGDSGTQTLRNLTIAHPTEGEGNVEAIRVSNGMVSTTNTIVASYSVGIVQIDGILKEDYNLYFCRLGSIHSISGTLIIGDHSLHNINPRFMNPPLGDYHLVEGSPAIDAGTSNSAPAFDIDGDPRPQGDGYDIGADEFYPNPRLMVSKQAGSNPAQAGEQLTYILRLTNTGNVTLTATVTDILPDPVSPGGLLTWTASLPAPGRVWSQTVMVTVPWGYSGTLTNVLQATTEEGASGIYTETTGVILSPPATPILLAPPDGTVTTTQALTLSWVAGAGNPPIGYNLGLDGATITTTATSLATQLPVGVHTWTVQTFNQAGYSDWAEPWTVEVTETSTCTPLTGVDITGPVTGTADTDYTFTATIAPPTATLPITYTWVPTPTAGQGTETVTYTWATTGVKTIAVTAENCDNLVSETRAITIVAGANRPPVADAGPPQTVPADTLVTLDGSASSDPDGDPLAYLWTQTGGTPVSFTPGLSLTTFTAPASEGVLSFTLTITDPFGLSDSDITTVTVKLHRIYLPVVLRDS